MSISKTTNIRARWTLRVPWDEYFCKIAAEVATRSTCPRLSVGAVLVKDKHIISTGYNGVPRGIPHCDDGGCVIVDSHCSLSIHAEVNAITHCGVDTRYSNLYVTANPCAKCVIAAHTAGIRRIVYATMYRPVDYIQLGLNANELPEIVPLKSMAEVSEPYCNCSYEHSEEMTRHTQQCALSVAARQAELLA